MTGAVIPAIISTRGLAPSTPSFPENIRSKVLRGQDIHFTAKTTRAHAILLFLFRSMLVSTATNLRKNTSAFVRNNREKAQMVYSNCFLNDELFPRIDLEGIIFAMKMITFESVFQIVCVRI